MGDLLKRFLGKGNFDVNANIEALRRGKRPMFNFPADLAEPMLDYMLERGFLEDISNRTAFSKPTNGEIAEMKWIRIERLPVSPYRVESYDLLSRWQGVLAAMHAWNQKVIVMMQRRGGNTYLYIGVPGKSEANASRCRTALNNSMPGVGLKQLTVKNNWDELIDINRQIERSNCAGAVTGIPSFRKDTQFGLFQTLDKVAAGFRDHHGNDANYTVMIIAEPLLDSDISELISKFQQLGSEIHTNVMVRLSENESVGRSQGTSTGVGNSLNFGTGQGTLTMVKGLVQSALACADPISMVLTAAQSLTGSEMAKAALQALGVSVGFNLNRSLTDNENVSYGESVSKEYLNKFAQYSERVTDEHCTRLRSGRSLGFWNAGVYILGDSVDDVDLLAGVLRSVYSGDKTHIEPIRTHRLNNESAIRNIRNFNLVPVENPDLKKDGVIADDWHFIGRAYQYVSTPVNTEELSIFSSLPRHDVPGVRFVKNAAKFASNPGADNGERNKLRIGKIVNMGVVQSNPYSIDIDALVRHSLIVGSTGCGKTTTSKAIINAVMNAGRPVLIIEPAKDEWVRWAIEKNKTLPADKKIAIFEPGLRFFEGERLSNLMLNPFQPAAVKGAPIDIQTRCEQVTSLINASLPTGDILPIILDEAIYTYLRNNISDFDDDEIAQLDHYPKLDGVVPVACKVLENRGYDPKVKDGLIAALETRFNYLTRGKRGKVLNNQISTPASTLFNQNCVINLSKIPSAKDRALIMSIILLSLSEYRQSAYTHDANYRHQAQQNKLMHLTVIEEAHNVLAKPPMSAEGAGNPQQVVADLFSNMLAEIRSMGEGLMIIDQVPTKLIPDVVKNTNYKFCHRLTSVDDSAVMAEALALREDQKGIIPTLEQGNAIVMGDIDDAASWVKISKS